MYIEDKTTILIIERYNKLKKELIDIIGEKVFDSVEASVNLHNNKIIFEDINSLKNIINRAVEKSVSKVLSSSNTFIMKDYIDRSK